MTVKRSEVRPGAYHDSIVLMQLQAELAALEGVEEAAVAMASEGNLALLEERDLLPEVETRLRPDDLLVVVRATSEEAASVALGRIDSLLERGGGGGGEEEGTEVRPHSLAAALRLVPEAKWVLVSVPGGYAAGVAREALGRGCSVFLYSDNVPLPEEVELKQRATEAGLLLLGPDCGTAIVDGVGFGFANRVRRGPIGIVAASGTGLQSVATGIHSLGGGISHAIGTGGRDLHERVAGRTTLAALALLAADEQTRVVVLVSKPPAPAVARRVLSAAQRLSKPVVVDFLGAPAPARRLGNLHFASDLSDAAELAVGLADGGWEETAGEPMPVTPARRRYVRALMGGGTLALESALALSSLVGELSSNLEIPGVGVTDGSAASSGNVVFDLGADELTRGRPHPMIDQTLLLDRLAVELADPSVAIVLLDVILGDGVHPDPASALAERIRTRPSGVEVVVILVGTDEDPQHLASQVAHLEAAGASVYRDARQALSHVAVRLAGDSSPEVGPGVEPPRALEAPAAVVNVGLELFHRSLLSQGVRSVQVQWRPPAGGDPKLVAILERMRR